jgi:hypothetical protein
MHSVIYLVIIRYALFYIVSTVEYRQALRVTVTCLRPTAKASTSPCSHGGYTSAKGGEKKKHAAHSMGDGGDRPLYVSVVARTGNAAANEQEKKKDRKRTRLCAVEW